MCPALGLRGRESQRLGSLGAGISVATGLHQHSCLNFDGVTRSLRRQSAASATFSAAAESLERFRRLRSGVDPAYG